MYYRNCGCCSPRRRRCCGNRRGYGGCGWGGCSILPLLFLFGGWC